MDLPGPALALLAMSVLGNVRATQTLAAQPCGRALAYQLRLEVTNADFFVLSGEEAEECF